VQPALRSIAALLVACLGCAGGQPEDFCTDNADCETRLTCFLNRCHRLEPLPPNLVWEIAPGEPARTMTVTAVPRTQPIVLEHCETTVEGDVSELGRVRVDVEGSMRGLSGVCVREQHVVEGEFSLPLVPGKWRLTFHPTNAPPLVRTIEFSQCVPVPLGAIRPRELARLRFLPVFGPDNPEPRCGIRVQAFDAMLGEPLSLPLSVRLGSDHRCRPPSPQGWELDVQRPQEGERFALVVETEDAAAPVMRRQVIELDWAEAMEPVILDTRSRPAERVFIDLRDPDGQPVDGVRLQAIWPEEADDGCLASRIVGEGGEDGAFRSAYAQPANSPGGYELWLPPGPHLFRAIPPAALDLASRIWSEPVTVREGGGNVLLLRLERKPVLEGTVYAEPGREPSAEARIHALPLRAPARGLLVRTDAQGGYRMRLDPGPYLILADPRGNRLPRTWTFVEVGDAGSQRVDIGIDLGRTVAGQARSATGPLPYAIVRVWDVGGSVPVVAGETVTDAEGRFVLRIRR